MQPSKVTDLKNGQVIKTTCTDWYPCWHLAILILDDDGWHIYQNTPGLFNKFGGNVVRQRADEFFDKRTILKVFDDLVCPEVVRCHAWENRFKRWNGLNYNCEDFINEVAIGQRKSDLRNLYVLGGLAIVSLWKK